MWEAAKYAVSSAKDEIRGRSTGADAAAQKIAMLERKIDEAENVFAARAPVLGEALDRPRVRVRRGRPER